MPSPLTVFTVQQKHFCWIRRLSELPVDGLNFARPKRLYGLGSRHGVQFPLGLLNVPVHGALADAEGGRNFPAGLAFRCPCQIISLSFAHSTPTLTIRRAAHQRGTTSMCVHADEVKRLLRPWFEVGSLASHRDACLKTRAANDRHEEPFVETKVPGNGHDLDGAR